MTKIVMALVMVGAMALVACGSDDDSSGKKPLEHACDTDPNGAACQACLVAYGECVNGPCSDEDDAFMACIMACSDEEADCCDSEYATFNRCMANECPAAASCG